MKIGLIDVDSHNFPNLCLMKLSEYHTRRGDRVEWWSPKGRYDLVYKSRVFTDTYSKDTIVVDNAEEVIQGGTGYGPGGKDLPYEIEHILHYCVANIPGAVPSTSTLALTNATLPYVIKLADKGWEQACEEDAGLRLGLNLVDGILAYPAGAEAFPHICH